MNAETMNTNTNSWILKGMICYSKSKEELSVMENGYLVCCQGICQGVFPSIPEEFKSLPLTDYQDALIFPGMTDLHLHAPQYPFCGLGMDLELLEWLESHTFPEESRYCSLDYARQAYGIFTEDLKASPTTRAVIFSTIHSPATRLLMDMLEDTGLATYVGKVNMDQNCPDFLREADAHAALEDTRQWLKDTMNAYRHTKPILTPRFAPTCSAALMEGLGKLQREYKLPVPSFRKPVGDCLGKGAFPLVFLLRGCLRSLRAVWLRHGKCKACDNGPLRPFPQRRSPANEGKRSVCCPLPPVQH